MSRSGERGPDLGGSGLWSGAVSGDFFPAPTPEASVGTDDFDLPEPSRYVRGALLGVGGMGRVVAAQDLRLGRMVALKEALPGNEARLAREAKITAILDHPGIVPVHDAGRSADGRAWYVMRLVRGHSLAEAITGAGDLRERLRLLRHLLHACQAMAYAHSLGVIHRDIKPENILVGEFGETQVMDWGLARQGQLPELPPVGEQQLQSQTMAGSLLGTPAYMSPEQARGEEVGPPTDIWSLGAVLYEILAGGQPFLGVDSRVALEQLRRGQLPPIRDRAAEAPPELVAVLERAMAPLPADRYPSAKLLAEDLASYLDGRPVAAYRYSPKELLLRLVRAWRLPLTITAVALMLLAGSLTASGLRILAERDRAQLAEAHTAAALAASDRHLAEALLQQAYHAQEAGHRAETEMFAIRSAAFRESPEARGILAGYTLAPRPRLLASTPLPTCEKVALSVLGDRALCLRDGRLHLHAGEKTVQQWELSVTDVAWVGERIFAVRASPRGVVEMLPGGSTRSLDISMGQVSFSGVPVGTLLPLGTVEALEALDVATGTRLSWGRASSAVLQRAISPDGGRMAAVLFTGQVVVGERDGSVRVLPIPDLPSPMTLVWIQNKILLGTANGYLALLDPESGSLAGKLSSAVGPVRALEPLPDHRRVAVLGDTGAAILDLGSGDWPVRFLSGERLALRVVPDGVAIAGRALQRWGLPGWAPPLRYSVRSGLTAAVPSPDGRWLALTGGDGLATLEPLLSGLESVDLTRHQAVVKGATFSPDSGQIVLISAGEQAVTVYDLGDRSFRGPAVRTQLRRAGMLASGLTLIGDFGTGILFFRHRDLATWREVAIKRPVQDLGLSSAGEWAVALEEGGSIMRFPSIDQPKLELLFADPAADAVDISADGQRVLTVGGGELQLRALDGGLVWRRSLEEKMIDVAFSPGERWVAASSLEGPIRVWSGEDGRLLAVLRGHSNRVPFVEFSADGSTLFSASWDHSARRWGTVPFDAAVVDLMQAIVTDWGLSAAAAP